MEVVIVALIVSVIAPMMVAHLTNKQNRVNKEQDWARQDAVAAEAKRQQEEVAAQAAKAAELLLASNKQVAINTEQNQQRFESADRKLDVIHVLVNSNMTAAIQAELNATKRELLLMEELDRPVEAKRATEAHIHQLETQLAERQKQTEVAEAMDEFRSEDKTVTIGDQVAVVAKVEEGRT